MDLITLVLFVLGFFVLIGGAELLVRGASSVAAAAGISPLVIGLTGRWQRDAGAQQIVLVQRSRALA